MLPALPQENAGGDTERGDGVTEQAGVEVSFPAGGDTLEGRDDEDIETEQRGQGGQHVLEDQGIVHGHGGGGGGEELVTLEENLQLLLDEAEASCDFVPCGAPEDEDEELAETEEEDEQRDEEPEDHAAAAPHGGLAGAAG